MSARAARRFADAAEPADDDRHDTYEADEMPEPCRGCGSIHCDSECAEFRAWLTVAYFDWDAANGGDADAQP